MDVWIQLVCAVYFCRRRAFFRNSVYNSIIVHPDLKENQQLLTWVGYPPNHSIQSLSNWQSFLQKVTYHDSKVTLHHESKLLPSWEALDNHYKRAVYVLKLAYCVKNTECPFISTHTCEAYGWKMCITIVCEYTIIMDTPSRENSKSSCSGLSGCISNRCSAV